MSDEIRIQLRTADQTRLAELDLDEASTAGDIIQAAVDNWSLPGDTDYTLVNATTGRALVPGEALSKSVRTGDMIEVQPVLVAG